MTSIYIYNFYMGTSCGTCEAKAGNNMSSMSIQRTPERVIEDKFHNCSIRISQGDLLRENTDAIVAVLDPSLSFQGDLCRSIM
jgi:hypothetical protein